MFIYLPNVLELDDEFKKRAELFSDSSKEGVSILAGSISILSSYLASSISNVKMGLENFISY